MAAFAVTGYAIITFAIAPAMEKFENKKLRYRDLVTKRTALIAYDGASQNVTGTLEKAEHKNHFLKSALARIENNLLGAGREKSTLKLIERMAGEDSVTLTRFNTSDRIVEINPGVAGNAIYQERSVTISFVSDYHSAALFLERISALPVEIERFTITASETGGALLSGELTLKIYSI